MEPPGPRRPARRRRRPAHAAPRQRGRSAPSRHASLRRRARIRGVRFAWGWTLVRPSSRRSSDAAVRSPMRRPSSGAATMCAQRQPTRSRTTLPNQRAHPSTPSASLGIVLASREIASDGGGSSRDHASGGRRHGEELAPSRNAAGCHREPLFERRREGLLEVFGVDTGHAGGGVDHFVLGVRWVDGAGRRRGGLVDFVGGRPRAGTRQTGNQLGHEAKRLVGAGKRAGEKVFDSRRAAGENVFERSGAVGIVTLLAGWVEVHRRGAPGHTEQGDHGAGDAVDHRAGCERTRFKARDGPRRRSRSASGGPIVQIMSPPTPPR
jgi:hypothetical protein